MSDLVNYGTVPSMYQCTLILTIQVQYVQVWPSMTNYSQMGPSITSTDQLWKRILGFVTYGILYQERIKKS